MTMNCKEFENASALYLYDELSAPERADFEAHMAACESCRARLEESQRLHRVLTGCPRPEPTPDLLARCRVALDEALDREELGWRSLLRGWRWSLGAAPPTRAAAVLTLLAFGFGLGWTLRPRATNLPGVVATPTQSGFNPSDLSDLRIRSINQVTPDPQSGGVRISLDAERRVTLEGSLDDPHIRQVLVDTMKSYDNPGIRRDTLDALRMQTDDPSVRGALTYALLHDPNAGVRLEALKTVQHMECGSDTHQVLLGVVEHDSNAGVRTAAIDALVQHLQQEGMDDQVLAAFEKLATSDQDPVVRMRCLVAVRRLQGNE
jgi:hypothetical protein